MLKKVLMCKPTHFRVDYQINPWMKPGSVNTDLALQQWENLVSKYQENGIKVNILEQNYDQPDMVFAADQGLVISDKKILLSNFKYKERQGEVKHYLKWFINYGLEPEFLPTSLSFEGGGEIIPWNGKFFIGEGFRNSSETYQIINQKYGLEFISLELINTHFYHLDTCFFVLNSLTAFYYPPAFSQKSINLLKTLFPNLLEFTKNDALNFAANSVINGSTVFLQVENHDFKKEIQKMGYQTIEINVSEFMKSGGGIHCLTFELERIPHFEIAKKITENSLKVN
jgi:N-dimethylarginine dimethylaminohydrolase